jgi:rhodanese-related sulfurtransferase
MNMKSNKLNNAALFFTFVMVIVIIGSKIYSEDYEQTPNQVVENSMQEDAVSLQKMYVLLNSEKKTNYQFVDLREKAHYQISHVDGAINIPFKKLMEKANLETISDSDKTIVFYDDGEEKSSNAWFLLKQLGHDNITYLSGGYEYVKEYILKTYQPSYGHYTAEKPKYDFGKYFNQKEAPKKPEVKVETTITVSGGC